MPSAPPQRSFAIAILALALAIIAEPAAAKLAKHGTARVRGHPHDDACSSNCGENTDGDMALLEVGSKLRAGAATTVEAKFPHPAIATAITDLQCNAQLTGARGAHPRLTVCRDHLTAHVDPTWVAHASVRGHRAAPAFGAGPSFAYAGWDYDVDVDGRVVHAYMDGMTSADIAGGCASNDDLRAYVTHLSAPLGLGPYDAGHIRANCLGGDNEILNFIPQHPVTNQGIQCSIETATQRLLIDGGCTLNVHIGYNYPALNAGPVTLDYYVPTGVHYQVTVAAAGCNAGWPAAHNVVFDVAYPNV